MKRFFVFIAVLTSVSAWADSDLSKVSMYSRQNGGFLLVDDVTGEIIGFSDKGNVHDCPSDMRDIFQELGMDVCATSEVSSERLESMLAVEAIDSVGPLLGNIAYGQSAPYNRMTPTVGSQHCLTGCVAVAMAQIMAYHRYPETCYDTVVTYKTATLSKTVTADFGAFSPDWDNILPAYTSDYTEKQANAIAGLMFYCGASVQMDYNVSSSGALSEQVVGAMYKYFGYDIRIEQIKKSDFTDQDWIQILEDELNAGRPLYMSSTQASGSGHAYVCEGYYVPKGENEKQDEWYKKNPYFYINWGWDGSFNGWFRLNKLEPGSGNPENFTDLRYNQAVIRYIMPKGKTPVDNVVVDSDENVIYDIMGRRVSEMTPGHIYIRGGKKVVAQ